MFKQTIVLATAWIAAAAALAAVPEPTEQEIHAMTKDDIVRANQPIVDYHKQLGKSDVPEDMLIRLNGLKKLDCKPVAQADAHDCNVEMDLTVPQGGRRTRTMLLRFTKTEGGWKGARPSSEPAAGQ